MRVIPPNSLISPSFTQNLSDLKARTQIVSQEAVTGQYTDLTSQLKGDIGRAMTSHKALADINTQRSILDLRSGRADLTQKALGRIQDYAGDLPVRMLSAKSALDQKAVDLVALDARNALSDIFSALNQRAGDRNLFSGDSTATAPLPDAEVLMTAVRQIAQTAPDLAAFEAQINTFFNTPAGGWSGTATPIYKGTITSTDPDAVTAADPAIVGVIAGLSVLALGRSSENIALVNQNPDLLLNAASRTAGAKESLIFLRGELGMNQQRIESAKENLDTEETILNSLHTDIAGRDAYEAANELKLLETSLESAYLITGRVSRLSLLNFLR